jgi:plastocyanin
MRLQPFIFGAFALTLAGASARAEIIQIRIANLAFEPANVTARVGDTVQWINGDILAHTATARNSAFDVMILPNGKAGVVLKVPGEVDYYCKFHPNMIGHIAVLQ